MASEEDRVREAAQELSEAIVAARVAGYRVDWPTNFEGLTGIAVSETGRIGEAAKPAPGDEYEAMTKSALVELAIARGITVASSATKAEIIAALKEPAPA